MEPVKRQIKKNGVDKWEVDFGKDDLGVRRRPYFDTEKEADDALDAWKKDVKRGGDFWARLTPTERKQLVTVIEEIKAAKKQTSASEAVRAMFEDWKRWRKDNQQSVTTPMEYSKVVEEWGKRKLAAGKTKRYVENAQADLLKFAVGREQQPIHEFTFGELEDYIDKHRNKKTKKPWGLSSRKTVMALFSSLWTVAVNKGWASFNIVDRLEPITRPKREVRIYKNETTLNLMAAAMSNNALRLCLGPLTLGFFGCMRPEEIQSAKAINEGVPKEQWFGWHDIDLDYGLVKVRTEIAKTGDERTIRLQPNAVLWLKVAKKAGCTFPPENETKLVNECCAMIGLEDWIRDGLRKCCATHLRVVYKNDYEVVQDMGNSVRVLLKHYAKLHTPEKVSLEHWDITPELVEKYLKTDKWKKVVEEAAKAAFEKTESSNASASSPKQSSNETSKRAD
ncbi:MAG TPA: hypothetical protein VGW37_05915 [Terriglobia bacterium]|nr:hypothetical protein [Terriglobia bacterium]